MSDEGRSSSCPLCGMAHNAHDCPPGYLCNCGQMFPSHLARVVHAATCPAMTTPARGSS